MIFKIKYNSVLHNIEQTNIYTSFCRSKLDLWSDILHNFLYAHLYDKKIINFSQEQFNFDIHRFGAAPQIKCYIQRSYTRQWYCTLEELLRPSETVFHAVKGIKYVQQQIINTFKQRAADDIRYQVDAEILQELENAAPDYQNNIPINEYIRRTNRVNYVREALALDPLPEPNYNYYNYVVNPTGNNPIPLVPIQIDPIDE